MNMKKLFLLNLPYLLFVYPFDKLAQAFRLAPGSDLSGKLLSIGDGFTAALSSLWLSFHPTDLLIGIAGAVVLRMAVYLKGKNAKKYRHGIRNGFRVGKVAFQHGGSGAKPVCPFLPCQRLYLVFQYLFFMLRPPQLLFRFLYLLIEFFQLFIHRRLSSFLGMSTYILLGSPKP